MSTRLAEKKNTPSASMDNNMAMNREMVKQKVEGGKMGAHT